VSNGITAWSYSRYNDYVTCPLRFKLKYIDKLPVPGSPAMERGSKVHKEGENWLKGTKKGRLPASYQNFREQMTQLKELSPMVEQQWGFTQSWTPTGWFSGDTWLRIICDVAVVYEDNTADVIDFKTGRKYETNEEQVELFTTGVFMKFPEVNQVTTRLWYLDQEDDNEVIREFDRSDFERIRKEWDKKVVKMFKDKKFAPTPSSHACRWCPFKKSEGGPCPY
jgi:RecB family exonuclease